LKSISILGSGWLGLPLAIDLSQTYNIKLSTRTEEKKVSLEAKDINTFLLDIDTDYVPQEINEFLQSDILIINIPSKNIDGFKKLLEYIEHSNIKRIIFISSTSVCNNDTSPLKTIEVLFQNTDIQTTILRFGGLFGYSRNPANFFKNGRTVKNPYAPVNMIHRDDCISIIEEIIRQDIFDEVFNCCSPSHPSKKEFYTYCAVSSALEIPIFDTLVDESTYKVVNSDKLISRLNYKFIHANLLNTKVVN
jgi:nucleoside-diphosphate-sugar epimerase